jgi:hypothetical protein
VLKPINEKKTKRIISPRTDQLSKEERHNNFPDGYGESIIKLLARMRANKSNAFVKPTHEEPTNRPTVEARKPESKPEPIVRRNQSRCRVTLQQKGVNSERHQAYLAKQKQEPTTVTPMTAGN